MVYTECGKVYSVCPQSGEVRPMLYAGFEKKRQTQKYRSPWNKDCTVLAATNFTAWSVSRRMPSSASYASRSTTVSIPAHFRSMSAQHSDMEVDLWSAKLLGNARVGSDSLLDDYFLPR